MSAYLDKKLGTDFIWSLGSFAILAASGILLNVIIGMAYDASALGLFNLAFALYIFIAQFGVFGIHLSTLKEVAEHADDTPRRDGIITNALVGAVITASTVTAISYGLSHIVNDIFGSERLEQAWLYLLPGLWFFCLNKVTFAAINGLRYMRAFAIFQSVRYLMIMAGVVVAAVIDAPAEMLTLAITISEAIVFIASLVFLLFHYRFAWVDCALSGIKKHYSFGSRSFLSVTVVELNSRVDILMLGIFLDEAQVGIYSMAALIAEGVAQLATVIRNNVNPILTKQIVAKDFDDLKAFTKKIKRYFYAFMTLTGIAAIIIYPFFIKIFFGDQEFGASLTPFMILIGGLVLASGYLPFNMTLIQAGLPGTHTLYMIGVLCTNAILNLVFIPFYGIVGAALATALTFCLSAVYLVLFVRRTVGVTL